MKEYCRFNRPCQICGVMMHNVAANKKLCPSCLKKNQRARDSERKATYRVEEDDSVHRQPYVRKYRPQKKPTQDNSLGAVCARANAAGRTYGQQVEFERRQKELRDRGEI